MTQTPLDLLCGAARKRNFTDQMWFTAKWMEMEVPFWMDNDDDDGGKDDDGEDDDGDD